MFGDELSIGSVGVVCSLNPTLIQLHTDSSSLIILPTLHFTLNPIYTSVKTYDLYSHLLFTGALSLDLFTKYILYLYRDDKSLNSWDFQIEWVMTI